MLDLPRRLGRAHDRLLGRTAVVTGAGSQGGPDDIGTGRAIAVVLAREGAEVGVVDIDATRAERTREIIEANGGSAFVITGDLADAATCERVIAETLDRCGKLDILVNNVAVGAPRTMEEVTSENWDRLTAVILKSAVMLSKHAVAAMTAGSGGCIVNISSIGGLRAHGTPIYGPAKAAMIAFTRELAVLYGRKGVRANVITPGHIYTPMTYFNMTPELRDQRRRISPLDIEGDAWDVALAALFLASDDARFVTGACLPVDGGVAELAALTAQEMLVDRV